MRAADTPGARAVRRLLRLGGTLLGVGLVSAVFLELGSCAAVETGWVDAQRPRYGRDAYWRGNHPDFGVWRLPDAEFEHRTACFQARYRTNSVGARDVERELSSSRRRVVVLGDSFLEGWGLPLAERLSNRLEAATGVEHLNFAMTAFGPYQALLVYRGLARRYSHDAVLLGLLPSNDFRDIDFALASGLVNYAQRYRPYLLAADGGYERFDYREPALNRVLREHSYAFNAMLRLVAEIRGRIARDAEQPGSPAAGPRTHSWFYDFEESQARLLDTILIRLAREAHGKRLVVVLLPVLEDLQRYRQAGPDPLSARLRGLGEREGFRLVNLLPAMATDTRRWERYFFACDYHWSALGNRVAFAYLVQALRADFYGQP